MKLSLRSFYNPPLAIIFFTFMVAWTLSYKYIRENSFRDPSSKFYDIKKAHTPRYSHIRVLEADHFIDEHSGTETFKRTPKGKDAKPYMCVGIPTMARKGVRYFRNCVGSLLHNLDPRERQELHLMPFFAQSNASLHPAFAEKWVENVADTILEYDPKLVNMGYLREIEQKEEFIRKGLLDYVFLLKKCYNTEAEYVTILEDDTLALDGWYHRVKHALKDAEEKTYLRGRTTFTYLRLFWTEEYLGWVREHKYKHMFWIGFWIAATGALCLGVRASMPAAKRIFNIPVVLLLTFYCMPMVIYLVFAAGRSNSVGLGRGVQEMNAFGCCGQGMAIPKSMVPELIKFYEKREVGYIDSLTEIFADETGHLRWALFPSVLQHLGTKSSKDTTERKVAYNRIFNHAFEVNDAFALAEEHEAEIERIYGDEGD